jgi:hypothetical protein
LGVAHARRLGPGIRRSANAADSFGSTCDINFKCRVGRDYGVAKVTAGDGPINRYNTGDRKRTGAHAKINFVATDTSRRSSSYTRTAGESCHDTNRRHARRGARIGCTAVRIGCGRLRVDCTRVRIGCSRLRVDCTRVRIGCARLRVDCTRVRIGCGRLRVDCARVPIGRARPRVGCIWLPVCTIRQPGCRERTNRPSSVHGYRKARRVTDARRHQASGGASCNTAHSAARYFCDVHAHCDVPQASPEIGDTNRAAGTARTASLGATGSQGAAAAG